MSYKNSIKQALSRNQSKKCKVPGCQRNRSYLSGYCNRHHNRVYEWGHPEGRCVYPKEYAKEKDHVKELIAKNPDHPGIKRAVTFFESWMKLAMDNQSPGSHELSWLHYSGVTGLDCLIESAAVWLYFWKDPTGYRDTGMYLTYTLAHRLFMLAPRETTGSYIGHGGRQRNHKHHIRSKAKKAVGEQIKRTLLPLFISIHLAVQKKEEAQKQAHEDLRKPFGF